MTRQRILVLYYWDDGFQRMRPAIRQHLHALDSSSTKHRVHYLNLKDGLVESLLRSRFDVVILHTTLLCYRWSSSFAEVRESLRWLAGRKCLKIAMPQDEYDHSEVLDHWLAELGVAVICSNFGDHYRPLLYPRMHTRARFLKGLTGYIDETNAAACATRAGPIAGRPLDIVYRAAHLPYWFGSHGQLKHQIASTIASRARALGLVCDISTRPEDVITSDAWYGLLGAGKSIIGCESGSSVLDRRGEIQAVIRGLLAQTPTLSFAEVGAKMPAGWDDFRFFALGPRHLEAVVTRTCQVLVEGEYDGVLQPVRHYLPLRRDLGNLDEVLHMIKDHGLLESTAARAFEDIYESKKYTYARFASELEQEFPAAAGPFAALLRCLHWRVAGSILGRACRRLFSALRWFQRPTRFLRDLLHGRRH